MSIIIEFKRTSRMIDWILLMNWAKENVSITNWNEIKVNDINDGTRFIVFDEQKFLLDILSEKLKLGPNIEYYIENT